MDSKNFVFVYDHKLAKHLKFNLGINFITNAIHKNTGNEFWLFVKTSNVKAGIKEWKDKMSK